MPGSNQKANFFNLFTTNCCTWIDRVSHRYRNRNNFTTIISITSGGPITGRCTIDLGSEGYSHGTSIGSLHVRPFRPLPFNGHLVRIATSSIKSTGSG